MSSENNAILDDLLGNELGIYVQRTDSIKIFDSESLDSLVAEGCFLDEDAKPAKFFVYPGKLSFYFRSCIFLDRGYIFEGNLKTPIGPIDGCRIYVSKDNLVN